MSDGLRLVSSEPTDGVDPVDIVLLSVLGRPDAVDGRPDAVEGRPAVSESFALPLDSESKPALLAFGDKREFMFAISRNLDCCNLFGL